MIVLHTKRYSAYVLSNHCTSTKFYPRISIRFRITPAALYPTIWEIRCSQLSIETLSISVTEGFIELSTASQRSCNPFQTTFGHTSGDQHVQFLRPRVTAASFLECSTVCQCKLQPISDDLAIYFHNFRPRVTTAVRPIFLDFCQYDTFSSPPSLLNCNVS